MKTYLEVSAIENGTVIDHIPSGSLFKIMSILNLEEIKNRITFGNNLESKRIGTKAIIKISDLEVPQESLNKIAIFAPMARVSYIKNFSVYKKLQVVVPDTIEGSIKCANPICVTNKECVAPQFMVMDKENISLRCHYCEKITTQEQFEIIK